MLLKATHTFSRQFLMRCLLNFKSVLIRFCFMLQGLRWNATLTSLFLLRQWNIVMVGIGNARRTWLSHDRQGKVPRGQRGMGMRQRPQAEGGRTLHPRLKPGRWKLWKILNGSGSRKMTLVSVWSVTRKQRRAWSQGDSRRAAVQLRGHVACEMGLLFVTTAY